MSILIKGMDMPKSCGECEFNYYLEGGSYEWCECVILHDDLNQFDTRRTDCPLVEIPTPHGDLIDRDIVRDECYKTMEELMQMTTINISAEALSLLCGFTIINDAPTIIKAEECDHRPCPGDNEDKYTIEGETVSYGGEE